MEFIAIILVTFLFWVWGIVLGWNAREEHAKKVIEKHFVNNVQDYMEKIEKDIKRITIEKHNDTFYVYDEVTQQFMAQGKTQMELENILSSKFPGKKFACAEQTLKEVGFLS